MSDDTLVHILLSVVAALLTILYGIAGWNWIKLNGEVKELKMGLSDKVDTDEVERRHAENKLEFGKIENLLTNLRTYIEGKEARAEDVRERTQRDIQTLVGEVAGIKGYISGTQK